MEENNFNFSDFNVALAQGDIVTNFHKLLEDLKNELKPFMSYAVVDETVVPEARKLIANLRKVRKLIDDKRLKTKKEFMVPYNEFEAEVKLLLAEIDKPIDAIDTSIKMYEEMWRSDRRQEIQEQFDSMNVYSFLELDHILQKSWLAQSTSRNKWLNEMNEAYSDITNDLGRIESNFDEASSSQVLLDYLNHGLDYNKAVQAFEQRNSAKEKMALPETVTILKSRYDELLEIEELYNALVGQ